MTHSEKQLLQFVEVVYRLEQTTGFDITAYLADMEAIAFYLDYKAKRAARGERRQDMLNEEDHS